MKELKIIHEEMHRLLKKYPGYMFEIRMSKIEEKKNEQPKKGF
jgi:hypothetical protein